ncbi:glycosyl hydrolase family 8 [Afifella marina]|uniref:cellulase n=1 Tax=Afifella marina DSM 2698 TaxID=1120955 RepID=A0A1G5NVI2_AFIMA|nr:glycosyl hydrolase family 8 [Afifella marina]SCZ41373.1 endoglucanase [Afifella marina DSM 2698]
MSARVSVTAIVASFSALLAISAGAALLNESPSVKAALPCEPGESAVTMASAVPQNIALRLPMASGENASHVADTRVDPAFAGVATAAPVSKPIEIAAAGAATGSHSVAAKAVLPAPLWANFRDNFIGDDGRVIDDGNGKISHSEGQGYGLLLAAFADDPVTFRRLWNWTVTELLIRDDGLAAWRWEPDADPHVTDPNNATDGDILIAWALMEGATRFNEQEYRKAAADIAAAIYEKTTEESAYGRVILPGVHGFRADNRRDGPVINLSYWVFPAFPALAKAAPQYDWNALRDSGVALMRAARFGKSNLPSDWISLSGEKPRPANGFPPTFAYNAIRIPLYAAWAKAGDRSDLAPYQALWERAQPSTVDVMSGRAVQPLGGPGYAAVAGLVACAREGTPFPSSARSSLPDLYYPSALQALSVVAAQEAYSGCR